MTDEMPPIFKAVASWMEEMIEERERYRRALVSIAEQESGVWGVRARTALYPEGKAA